jgi:cell division protein FtsB
VAQHSRKPSYGVQFCCILCLVASIGIAVLGIFGRGGYLEMRKILLEVRADKDRVIAIQNENERRLDTIQRLRWDKEFIKKYAREQGYVMKDEIIQLVPAEDSSHKQ